MAGIAARPTILSMSDMQLVPVFADIANVVGISGPSLSLDSADVTSHDSTGGWEEVVPTILRTGEVTFEINYDPTEATHNATAGLPFVLETAQLTDFTLLLPIPAPGGTLWEFEGYVTGFEPGAPHDGKLTASVTIKIDGVPTLV